MGRPRSTASSSRFINALQDSYSNTTYPCWPNLTLDARFHSSSKATQSHFMIIIISCNELMQLSAVCWGEKNSVIKGERLEELNLSCTVSRNGETCKTRPRSGLAISHHEGSLIKGNGLSGNFECVFSACLGDSNSKTDAETIRASQRMFSVPPPPFPTHTHIHTQTPCDCTSKLSTECKSWFYCLTPLSSCQILNEPWPLSADKLRAQTASK